MLGGGLDSCGDGEWYGDGNGDGERDARVSALYDFDWLLVTGNVFRYEFCYSQC